MTITTARNTPALNIASAIVQPLVAAFSLADGEGQALPLELARAAMLARLLRRLR
jgi:hypothetical protein